LEKQNQEMTTRMFSLGSIYWFLSVSCKHSIWCSILCVSGEKEEVYILDLLLRIKIHVWIRRVNRYHVTHGWSLVTYSAKGNTKRHTEKVILETKASMTKRLSGRASLWRKQGENSCRVRRP
jgi:hypothetical protein